MVSSSCIFKIDNVINLYVRSDPISNYSRVYCKTLMEFTTLISTLKEINVGYIPWCVDHHNLYLGTYSISKLELVAHFQSCMPPDCLQRVEICVQLSTCVNFSPSCVRLVNICLHHFSPTAYLIYFGNCSYLI